MPYGMSNTKLGVNESTHFSLILKRHHMKLKFVLFAIIALSITGCATTKNWSATGGSRSDGVVKLSYEMGLFEQPQVNEQEGVNLAKQRCSSWGYNNSEAFGGLTKVCSESGSSGCTRWIVTKEYQCLGSLEK